MLVYGFVGTANWTDAFRTSFLSQEGSCLGDDMFEAHPDCPLCYSEYWIKAAPATRLIDDGDVLDLGDLSLIHI